LARGLHLHQLSTAAGYCFGWQPVSREEHICRHGWQDLSEAAGLWDGDVKPFNPQYTNKLLFVDENRNSHKPEQYAELKRITGSDKLPINKKYESEFNAPNNLNLIFATNDPKPIALKWGEGPRSEKVNNFFIHYCKEVPR
jgi:hypothetical protein